MPSLSYQEKSLYGTLAAEVLVYGAYFIHVPQTNLNRLVGVIAALIVVQIVLQAVIAGFTRNRLTDERDRLIALRGYRAGYLTMVSCLVVGFGALWLHTSLGQLNPNKLAIHFLNAFFAILVISEIVKTVSQLVAYRRSI
jgi:hypothetical protein